MEPHLAKIERSRRIGEKLERELGALVFACLNDPQVVDILLNPDGAIWVERLGGSPERLGEMPPYQAEALIATVASEMRTTVTVETPILECELPLDGSRFSAIIPPVVSAPCFAIRRRAGSILRLTDYIASGIMSAAQAKRLARAIEDQRNIVIAGGTGSGKTTLANALLAHMADALPEDRLVIIEDTAELQCAAPNAMIMRATSTVSLQRLVRATMRFSPKRIIVGEVRGGEALELIKAWNTGHPGGVASKPDACQWDGLRGCIFATRRGSHRWIHSLPAGQPRPAITPGMRSPSGRTCRARSCVAPGFRRCS